MKKIYSTNEAPNTHTLSAANNKNHHNINMHHQQKQQNQTKTKKAKKKRGGRTRTTRRPTTRLYLSLICGKVAATTYFCNLTFKITILLFVSYLHVCMFDCCYL